MRSPLVSLKTILGELLVNGRRSLQEASLQGDRLAAIEQRLTGNEQALSSLVDSIESVKLDINRLAGVVDAAMSLPLPPIGDSRIYFGLDELDRILKSYIDREDGYFVELGANDGVTQSNTIHFERYRGWRGVLVEPTPHNFLKCLANRSEHTQVSCCACASFDYQDKFVEIAFSNLMSSPVGLESDVSDPFAHAEEGRQFLAPSDRVFTFGAIARPLNELLAEAAAPATIDLLSLVVEGAEIEVLKGIDHDRFRFRFMRIESRDIDRILAYLDPLGYELVRS